MNTEQRKEFKQHIKETAEQLATNCTYRQALGKLQTAATNICKIEKSKAQPNLQSIEHAELTIELAGELKTETPEYQALLNR